MDIMLQSSSFLAPTTKTITSTAPQSTATTLVPQPWSLLAHHRNVRSQHSAGKVELPPISASPSPSSGGGLVSPCAPQAVDEETSPCSPTVSTVSFALRPTAGPSHCNDNAMKLQPAAVAIKREEEGKEIVSVVAAGEKGEEDANKVLAYLKRRTFTCLHTEEEESLLSVFADVLDQVRCLHLSQCPLCAPQRPPNWWTSVREGKRRRESKCENNHHHSIGKKRQKTDADNTDDNNNNDNDDGYLEPHILESCKPEEGESIKENSQTTAMAMKKRTHQQLLVEAVEFLEHVYSRREHLQATRPSMYAVCPESHALQRECTALGGINLLESLLLGL